MPTAKELGLSCGDPFQHTSEAGVWILGKIHDIDREGNIHAWVEVCSLNSPVDEMFPERKVVFTANDSRFSRIPEPEVQK